MKYTYTHSTTLFIVITMIVALGITTVGVQTVAAEDMRKAIEAGNAKFLEAFNQGDAAAVAALYTDGGLKVLVDRIRGVSLAKIDTY